MRERLTREQAIKEHRKMWLWIAEQYRNGSKEDIYLLKERYIAQHTSYSELDNDCFCCEYSLKRNEPDCGKCPIDFGEGGYACESNENSPYKKLIEYDIFDCCESKYSNYMAELTLQIANLPEREEKINLYPTECNLCGGKVIFTSNRIVYGKEYGSGKCYYCTECGAYVGTHKPRPSEALGILANKEMRELKKECHEKFDKLWKGKKKARIKRKRFYKLLANELGIAVDKCHFGYFYKDMLIKALNVLERWEKENEIN